MIEKENDMRELDQMIAKGLAEIDTSERAILALTLLTNLALKRDLYYRFFCACAGPSYIQDTFYWRDFIKANLS